MSDADQLLDIIEEGLVSHGGDLGGWTRRADDALQIFDGRVTLRASVNDLEMGEEREPEAGMAHAHVRATLHEHDDEVLDACLIGMGDDRKGALGQAAIVWMTCVAGPIRSFLDNKPVCMTCQAGVSGGDTSQGFVEGDYGLPGLRAYVGPSIARGFDDPKIHASLNDTKPWFRYAAESAAPRRVHLAKATILGSRQEGWKREMEIDGHEVAYSDPHWDPGIAPPEIGYLTRFAVFEFPRNSREITRRAALERTIRYFAEHYGDYPSVDELMAAMTKDGFDAELVSEVEAFSTIAFGRALFEHMGANYSPTVIRARRDGRVETDVPLMTIPAYTRGRAIAAKLRETMDPEKFQALALYNAESHAMVQVLEAEGDQVDLSKLKMYPLVIPDPGVSDQTMEAALAKLNALVEEERAKRKKKKPWWKFW